LPLQFDLFALAVADSTAYHVHELFATVTDTAERITLHSQALNETFPFVTTPTFEVLGSHVIKDAAIEAVY